MLKQYWSILILLFCVHLSWAQDTIQLPTEEGFKLSDISSAITETNQSIQLVEDRLESQEDLNNILKAFNGTKASLAEFRLDTSLSYWQELSLSELEGIKAKWTKYQETIKSYDKSVTDVNHHLDDLIEVVNKYEDKWKVTAELAAKDSVEVVQERIQSMIDELEAYRQNHKTMSDLSYKVLDSITQENIYIVKVINNLKDVYTEKKGMIFVKDSPGFFEMHDEDTMNVKSEVWRSWTQTKDENRTFLRQNKQRIFGHVFIFFFILGLFFVMKRQLNTMDIRGDHMLLFDRQILKRPVALAFLIAMTLFFWYYPNRPRLLSQQILFLVIAPAAWVLYGFVKKDYRLALIAVAILYFFDQVQNLVVGQTVMQRWLLMIEGLLALAFSIYFARPKSIIYQKQKNGIGIHRIFPIIPIFLAIAIYANYNGSVILSKMITNSIVRGAAVAIVLYMLVSVIEGLIAFLVASPLQNGIRLFKEKGDDINRYTRLITRVWATYTWIMSELSMLRIKDSVTDWWEQLLAFGWEFGEVNLTVELLFNFILIIIVFSVVANLSRALLEIEILPRFNLKKGVPMAIATVSRYFILVLGFFMAVAAAGISLDKLGFLAGALGVGIGFGLQNIVGNFVSGLVLVFERPIHINDVIVTENIEGVVKEIGIRASKVRSWDGAEVIVPNMDLISRQVTNWTLSDENRRREVILRLEYNSDPNQVIEIVRSVLEKHEEVLTDPGPMILFKGYQEYSIDFRVLFWLNGNMLQGTSDVTLDIHNSLKNAGIQLAVPRQHMILDQKAEEQIKKEAGSTKKPATRRKSSPRSTKGGSTASGTSK